MGNSITEVWPIASPDFFKNSNYIGRGISGQTTPQVHPNTAGYMVMEKLVQPAIEQALAASAFSVNPFFTDHMVLQQKEKVTVWGKAFAGSQVVVNGGWGKKEMTITDASGNWKLNINTPKAGRPFI